MRVRVARADQEFGLFIAPVHDVECARVQVGGHAGQHKVVFPVQHVLHQRVAWADADIDLGALDVLFQPLDRGHHIGDGRPRHRPHAHGAGAARAKGRDLVHGVGQPAQQPARVADQDACDVGGHHPLGRAGEQRLAHHRLDLGQHPRGGGLGDRQTLGGHGQLSVFVNRVNQPQVAPLQA